MSGPSCSYDLTSCSGEAMLQAASVKMSGTSSFCNPYLFSFGTAGIFSGNKSKKTHERTCRFKSLKVADFTE
ncbi:hypothetical protein LA733_3693 [Leptospira interrogans]|nr:hypothetical protein LA733_3693 [Leptospira interrogans]KWV22000.1 hypothetical protein LA702_3688 [Leptospira interrogans]